MKIHQALFGYKNGHSLIASSRRLSRDESKILLRLTDLSGAEVGADYDGYLTAFPIVDPETYVVARTWLAPERIRPGCVWTHCALLNYSDLATFGRLEDVAQALQKPNSQDSFDNYRVQLELENTDAASRHSELSGLRNVCRALVYSVYGNDARPVYITSPSRKAVEPLLFGLWAQQYPRLRRQFSMTSGAMRARSTREGPIDVQLGPVKRRSLMPENSVNLVLSPRAHGRKKFSVHASLFDRNILSDENSDTLPAWVDSLADDLLCELPDGSIRRFLWRFGSGIEGGRDIVGHLSDIFARLATLKSFKDAVQLVLNVEVIFPDPKGAYEFKSAFVCLSDPLPDVVPYEHRALLLRAIVEYASTSLSAVVKGFASAVIHQLWSYEPTEVVRCANKIATRHDPLSDTWCSAIGKQLTHSEEWPSVCFSAEFLFRCAEHAPELLTKKAFWSTVGKNGISLLISYLEGSAEWWKKLDALFSAAEAGIFLNNPTGAVRLEDPDFVVALLRKVGVMESHEFHRWACIWIGPLLDARVDLVSCVFADSSWYHGNVESWIGVLGKAVHKSTDNSKLSTIGKSIGKHFDGFASCADDISIAANTRIALASENGMAVRFAARSIAELYCRVTDNRLVEEAWRLVQELLDYREGVPIWDRGAALRRGIVNRFVRRAWCEEDMFFIIREAMFHDLVVYDRLNKTERQFLGNAVRERYHRGDLEMVSYARMGRYNVRKGWKYFPDI